MYWLLGGESLQLGSGSAVGVGGRGSGDSPMSLAPLRGGEEAGTEAPGGSLAVGKPAARDGALNDQDQQQACVCVCLAAAQCYKLLCSSSSTAQRP